MFSTMPSLSSVWNVQATSAGILARKLVSGLPSGSSGCLPSVAELAHRDLAEDAQPLLGVVAEQPAGLGAVAAVGRRLHGQDADGVDVVVGVEAGVGALVAPVAAPPSCGTAPCSFPGQVAVTSPGRTMPLGKLSRLYRLDVPTRPNGVPSGRCGDSLPSLASGVSVRRLVDAVDALVGHQGARPLLVVLGIVLDEQHLARLVDRLAVLIR